MLPPSMLTIVGLFCCYFKTTSILPVDLIRRILERDFTVVTVHGSDASTYRKYRYRFDNHSLYKLIESYRIDLLNIDFFRYRLSPSQFFILGGLFYIPINNATEFSYRGQLHLSTQYRV